MNKLKINNGLAAIILLASLFAGWQTLLLAVILMLIFCEVNDKVRNLMVNVIAFLVGLTLISFAWSIISDGVSLVFKGIESIVNVINSYLSYTNQISITTLQTKFMSPVTTIISFLDSGVDYLVMLTKFLFVISTLTGHAMKENPFGKKVSEYASKAVNYISSFEQPVPNNNYNGMPQNNNFQMNNMPQNNNIQMNNIPQNNNYPSNNSNDVL